MITHCITCDGPVEWAQTLRARKWIPLEPAPVEDGNLEVVHYGVDGTPIVRLVPLAERDGHDLRRMHWGCRL